MKIPPNMTEEQVVKEITFVVNKIAPKYTFYGYDVDDIKQEAFMICMDAMERYDHNNPLKKFLSLHLSNRLKNFVRDNYFISSEEEKRRVVMPGQLVNEDNIIDHRQRSEDKLDYSQMLALLDIKLHASYRADYLKIINDVYVPKSRREEVLSVVTEILEEQGYA